MTQPSRRKRRAAQAVALLGLLSAGCSSVAIGKAKSKVLLHDYAEGRIVDVALTDRLTGSKEMLFLSMPQKSLFLEGYITGIVTDYGDNPIQGVVVRAIAEGESKLVEGGKAAFQSSSFDAGVSDTNGVYRIRFALPILKDKVDVRGKFLYNPGWEQQKANLGKAYEPQIKESPFRLIFDQQEGLLVFAEGPRKLVVQSVFSGQPPKNLLPGAKAPEEKKPAKPAEDDLMKGFGLDQ